ncbi:MAG: alpha/beta fold hydrolase [Phenylobacterium sp.]|jgi:pimeloyl-ACP methyl ester carboxylesterase|uniref:alpha/beta fold hydrolase n=1 Tax=Phenylobacterium sp. TaxID=1871053 RepID=UPI00391DF817
MQPNATGYAAVDGLKVYYEVHGGSPTGGRTPLVLLHGGMMAIDTAFTRDLIPRFSKTRPVIAIEQQGHGHTGDRPGPFAVERMVDDTAGVLKHLGVPRAHLFGHSLGGMIATGMAIRHPDLTASAAVVSAFYRLDGMLPELVKMQTDPNHVPSPEIVPLLPTEQDFAAWKANFDRHNPDPASFESVLERLNAMLGGWTGWTDAQLRAIRSPVLIAIGDNDFTRIEHAADMYRLIPGAKLAILPDTTHMNIIERGAWLEPMVEARIAAADG